MGYGISGGRLVNSAPTPEMGITKMARMRKQMKQMEKIQKYAEAMRLSRM